MAEVTVIIPVYNCELFLDECITSILSQTYSDFKLILVNDGSKDSSLSICNEYAKKDNRITVVDQSNQGVSIARNNGLKYADSKYVMFVDSDDMLEENVLETMVNSQKLEETDLVVCGLRNFSKNAVGEEWKYTPGFYSTLEYTKVMLFFRTIPFIGGPVAKLYKTSILKERNILFEINQSFAEDFVFNMFYIRNAKKISIVDSCFYLRREDNVNSLSKSKRLQIPLWERKKYVNSIWQDTLQLISDNVVTDNVLIQKFAVRSMLDVFLSSAEKKEAKKFVSEVFSDTDELLQDGKMIKSYELIKMLYIFNHSICFAMLKAMANSSMEKLSILKGMNK